MDVVTALRRMWRLRFYLALGVAFALIVATLLTYNIRLGLPPTFESRQYDVGLASTSVLLDSESSQVADLGDPKTSAGPWTFSARAQLLANLLVSSPLRDRVAAEAGVPANRLLMKLATNNPNSPIAQPAQGTEVTVKASDPDAAILRVTLNDQVPIITFNTQAPNTDVAARLANSAVAALATQIQQAASADQVPNERKLVFEPLGRGARTSTETRGPTAAGTLLLAVALFAIWCAGVLGVDALARRWRQAGGADDADDEMFDEARVRSASPPQTVALAARARPSAAGAPAKYSLTLPERLERGGEPRRPDADELDRTDAPRKPPVGPRRVA